MSHSYFNRKLLKIEDKNMIFQKDYLETEYSLISIEIKANSKIFKTYESYIKNTLSTPHTNSRIQGINNKIKVIKRMDFGNCSFYHFKSRMLMVQSLTKPKLNHSLIILISPDCVDKNSLSILQEK